MKVLTLFYSTKLSSQDLIRILKRKTKILEKRRAKNEKLLKNIIPILFSTLGAFMAYNINFVANPLIFALKTSTLGNQSYCFLNKRWFFDKIFNNFIVRFFLHFGYEVSFKVLDKGAIEILGPYGNSH